jgi:predicted nucleotidyltransferase
VKVPSIPSKKPGGSISRKLSAEVAIFVAELGQLPYVTEVILFGSRARGDSRSDSDADVLVVLHQATKIDLRRLHAMQDEHNQRHRVLIQLLGIEGTAIKRRLQAGDIIVCDAMVEGISLYPRTGAPPSQQVEVSRFSMGAAAAQWLAVVEDSIASAEEGHERVSPSDPLAAYYRGYMPARVHGLAVAAVRSAMWTAFYLCGQRPDRKMALDTMAYGLGWATQALGDLFVAIDGEDEPSARRVTRVAAGYVDLVRKLAVERNVNAKRLGYRSIAAYRLILEKYPSRLDNPAQTGSRSKRAVLESSRQRPLSTTH